MGRRRAMRGWPLRARQCEAERRSLVRLATRPDPTAVSREDLLHDRQAHAGSFGVSRRMQPLPNPKQFPGLLRIEPGAAVAHEQDAFRTRYEMVQQRSSLLGHALTGAGSGAWRGLIADSAMQRTWR